MGSGCLGAPRRLFASPTCQFSLAHGHSSAVGADIHNRHGTAAGLGLPLLPLLSRRPDPLHQALDLPATDLNATGFGQMLLRLLIAGFIGPFQAHEPGQGRRVTALQPQSRIGRIMALLFAFVIVVIPCQREGTEQAVNPGAGSSLVMLAWLGLISSVDLVGGIL